MTGSSEAPGGAGLSRVVYLSRIRLGPDRRESEIVAEILKASVERNRKSRVSGCLLAINGWFIQLIEGPAAEVEATFGRIACDPRHGFLRVLDNRPVSERLFADWAMCARALSVTDDAICAVVGRPFNIVPDRLAPATAILLLEAVRKVQERHIEWLDVPPSRPKGSAANGLNRNASVTS